MSDASAPAPSSPAKSGRQQRRLRNFLLDKRFQLKYAGMLAGVAIAVSAIFGIGLWTTSQRLVLQGQDMVKQGQETVRRGQLAITERKKVNAVVAMSITKAYGDDPDLAKEFKDQTDDSKLEEEQKRHERDADDERQHPRSQSRTEAAADRAEHDPEAQESAVRDRLVEGIPAAISGDRPAHRQADPQRERDGWCSPLVHGRDLPNFRHRAFSCSWRAEGRSIHSPAASWTTSRTPTSVSEIFVIFP